MEVEDAVGDTTPQIVGEAFATTAYVVCCKWC